MDLLLISRILGRALVVIGHGVMICSAIAVPVLFYFPDVSVLLLAPISAFAMLTGFGATQIGDGLGKVPKTKDRRPLKAERYSRLAGLPVARVLH